MKSKEQKAKNKAKKAIEKLHLSGHEERLSFSGSSSGNSTALKDEKLKNTEKETNALITAILLKCSQFNHDTV